ncbi:MAG TPA: CpsD/CapB family tyrosine-protein kinase [Sedimentisphaerales bacterium]
MENIRQAIERAKESGYPETAAHAQLGPAIQPQSHQNIGAPSVAQSSRSEVVLNGPHLESKRIITHDISDPRAKSFDMLRTQVLQSMDIKSWHLLGTTSPSAGCGKTVVSINLALSIARQQEKPVLLVDLDLQKPQVANYLGLPCDRGMISLLEGRTDLPSTIIRACIKNQKLSILPCEASTPHSSEWMASRKMSAIIQTIKREFKGWTVIFDLPPLLTGDDVITLLPQIDCVLFVAAIGTTTISEIKECYKHLEATSVVRVVLNKSSEMPATYYS